MAASLCIYNFGCACVHRGVCYNNVYMLNCRMSLIDNDVFGSRNDKTLAELLLVAYYEFRTWCKSMRVACSQRPFTPKLVIKKAHGQYMSCKAHNGRIVLSWLAQRSSELVASGCTDPKVLLQTAALSPGSNASWHMNLSVTMAD